MIKRLIGITTVLLLILVIALALGIGSAKASTVEVQLHDNALTAVELGNLGQLRSGLQLNNVRLDYVLEGVGRQDLLTASARRVGGFDHLLNSDVLNSDLLPGALREPLALSQPADALDTVASASFNSFHVFAEQKQLLGV